LLRELADKPSEHFSLVFPSGASNLDQEFPSRRPIQCQIPQAVVANRAYRSEIAGIVTSTHGLGEDASDLNPRLLARVVLVRLA
jgi:hypothetical protein